MKVEISGTNLFGLRLCMPLKKIENQIKRCSAWMIMMCVIALHNDGCIQCSKGPEIKYSFAVLNTYCM